LVSVKSHEAVLYCGQPKYKNVSKPNKPKHKQRQRGKNEKKYRSLAFIPTASILLAVVQLLPKTVMRAIARIGLFSFAGPKQQN